jgi:diguanylate cyclase (GGDEF)-like protein
LALEAAQTQIEASRVINDANVNIIAQNKLSMSESLSELGRVTLAFETASTNALTDSLTKLPNRRLFNDRLHQAILASARSKTYTAVVFIDLDDFKPINDQYGHAVGDLLLIEIADRIKKAVRGTDTVARFGGDEFVVVLCDLNADRKNAVAEVASIGEKIGRSIAMLTTVKNGKESVLVIPQCTASIGGALSLYSRGATEIVFDSLLALADAAMYQAKQAGGNRLCIDESLAGFTRAPWASRSSNGAGRKNR